MHFYCWAPLRGKSDYRQLEHRMEAVWKDNMLNAEPEQHTWQIGQVPGFTLVEHQNAADYPLRQQIFYGLIVCGPLDTKQAI